MALRKSFKFRESVVVNGEPAFGEEVTTPPLYVRLQHADVADESISATFDCLNEATGEVVFQRRFAFPVDAVSDDLAAQAYAHVKSLPEFADAEDC